MVRFVEQVGRLESHDDVPLSLRQQLYAEEQQRRDRKSRKVAESAGGPSPVTINILPGHGHQTTPPNGRAHSVGPVQVWESSLADDLEIEGSRDVAVRRFSKWLQPQYQDPSLQEEVRKAEQAVLDEAFNLVQIYGGQASDCFIRKKVKRGVADRFMNDIPFGTSVRK